MAANIDLKKIRSLGDKNADDIIHKLVEQEGIHFLRQLMPFLSDYQNLSFQNQPQILQDFLLLNASFPAFYDKKNLIRATDFYRENQQNIGLILGLYSLPYCYLGADGAKVLYFSERIRNDTYKRLLETGNFLKAVMNYDNWSEQNIFVICLKVRLLHASIRYFTLNSNRWDMSWGFPINQEDMLGTNLAFSLIVLRGMEKLGYQIDKSYENAYLNTWNVIGFLLGIISENMPNNYLETVKIDKKIAQRQFKQSIESQQLTASLMQVIRSFAPNNITADLLQEQSRFLLGEKYAKMLGIAETNIPNTLLKVYNTTAVLMSKIF
ncbi:Rubber oxygenase [Emticicia aquatica]|uniref:Rubber oxygenase n=1 Tax=Emticicia aquatica TaxID=1681835 RepID=A0ABN8EZW7_9BACT|nr:oxygenase MpaB family protein [Emticicia aquatica]CAH0997531.1 Rubber oxygenase [Emticicia aquatica]